MAKETKIDEMTFKEASIELEKIVRSLEAGDLELEASLENYERGSALLENLKERLAAAEQKVQVLLDASQDDVVPDTTSAPSEEFLDE